MSGLQVFEGDLLLVDTPDGGDIVIQDGFFVNDNAFNNAVYLSLFGGNKEDNGRVQNNNEWWGNKLPANSAERMTSRFQAIIFGLPMTTKHIIEAENAASLDLAWLIEEGIGEEIRVDGRVIDGKRNIFNLRIDILSFGSSIYSNTFSLFWGAGLYGVRK